MNVFAMFTSTTWLMIIGYTCLFVMILCAVLLFIIFVLETAEEEEREAERQKYRQQKIAKYIREKSFRGKSYDDYDDW